METRGYRALRTLSAVGLLKKVIELFVERLGSDHQIEVIFRSVAHTKIAWNKRRESSHQTRLSCSTTLVGEGRLGGQFAKVRRALELKWTGLTFHIFEAHLIQLRS